MRRPTTAAALLWAAIVCGLGIANIVRPRRDGRLALTRVFAPYLRLPLVPAAVVLWRRLGPSHPAARSLQVAATIALAVRWCRTWAGRPGRARPGSLVVGVTSWNLRLGIADPARILDGLRPAERGFIGLVELTSRHAAAIATDADLLARFPYRSFHPRDGSSGSGLLSSYPFLEPPVCHLDPPMLVARVDLGTGRPANVVVVHPWAPRFAHQAAGRRPTMYVASIRDAQTRAIRASLDKPLAAGDPVLVFGDWNTTDREVGYRDMVRGLVDAYRAVGVGPGGTWGPSRWRRYRLALLRIDMLLTGGAARPLTIVTDCSSRASDHCILRARVEIRPTED